MKKKLVFGLIGVCLLACKKKDSPSEGIKTTEDLSYLLGGKGTVFDQSFNALGHENPNLDNTSGLEFFVGNSLFRQNWVTAPASTTARDGLGALFNSRGCSGCHPNDGKGKPEFSGSGMTQGLLLRLSIPGMGPNGGVNPHAVYGDQLQDQSVSPVKKEGSFRILYSEEQGAFPDGEAYSLRKPTYEIFDLNYGDMGGVLISPRIGSQIIGLGLLEAISETEIRNQADPMDANGDGISGKVNEVWNAEHGTYELGRFGWKANQPSVRQQVAGAFSGDLGITTPIFPDENCPDGVNCDTIPNGGEIELPEDDFRKVVLYSQVLAVPAQRDYKNDDVIKGKKLFSEIACSSCHKMKWETGAHEVEALSNQIIYPFTDMLLHDMGDGLADGRSDFKASGNEWRTPPLWGTGMIKTVNGHTFYLHDGRARSVQEAILWHGGEAETSKNKFMNLTQEDRASLLQFLNSI